MRLSEGIEWGLHCATVLAMVPEGGALPGRRLAEYHGVPEPYLAKHLQALVRAGLLASVPGPRGGYRLALGSDAITVLDVVEAIDGPSPPFRCTEIRQRGPAALDDPALYRLPCGIHQVMDDADRAWRDSLRQTTLADLVRDVLHNAEPRQLAAGAEWLQDALGGRS